MIHQWRPHQQQLLLPNLGDAVVGWPPGMPTHTSRGGVMFESAVQTSGTVGGSVPSLTLNSFLSSEFEHWTGGGLEAFHV